MANNSIAVQDKARKRYCALIDALFKKANIADPEALYDNAIFVMHDITFTLLHTSVLSPNTVLLLADFGKPPPEKRDLVLQRLMEANLYTYCDNEGPSFCISPENGHVVLMSRLALDSATPESTMFLMTSLVDMIQAWRQTHFLEETFPATVSITR